MLCYVYINFWYFIENYWIFIDRVVLVVVIIRIRGKFYIIFNCVRFILRYYE